MIKWLQVQGGCITLDKRYGMYLSFNNQQEGFEFPVLPGSFESSVTGDTSNADVQGLGKVNVIKSPNLATYPINSIFPLRIQPFVNTATILRPEEYVRLINKWIASKKPVRFVYTSPTLEINKACSIRNFTYREVAGSPGDIEFELELEEYKFYAAKKLTIISQSNATNQQIANTKDKREDTRIIPKTYTLKSGDSLWKIAKTLYGNGARYVEIQRLNNIKDSELRRLQIGRVIKLP